MVETRAYTPSSNDVAVAEISAGDVTWTAGRLALTFRTGPDGPVTLSAISSTGQVPATTTTQPLVEVMVTGEGRCLNNTRFTSTAVGARLRYHSHRTQTVDGAQLLDIVQRDEQTGLEVTTTFTASAEVAAARVVTTVSNAGTQAQVLEAVTTVATGALVYPGERAHDLVLYSGTGAQVAENRWTATDLWSQAGLVDINHEGFRQPGRGAVEAVGTSTWTTARKLPMGVLANRVTGRAFAWQIEHNGGWRWEIDDITFGSDAIGLLLLGPEDLDHHWSQELLPGQSFTTVPASFAVGADGFDSAVAALTRHRRWLRRGQTADRHSLLVFNDYMNTLNGDPTTERLLPLITAAASAGAECFCIDAGWYDDTELGDWFPSVGAWTPSERRFPDGGLARVVQAIHDTGMRAGIWVEPEVIGVKSAVADTLPDAAFLQRHGRRVVEHTRYFLDMRHPAAREHLDLTFDRLINDFGISYFKLDYNVTPGPGTDLDAFSVGAGLLGHNRAHLDWFDGLRRRHPEVIFENCSSGAMRADFAMLERFDLQSTSDQEDFRLYPPIAAAAPLQMLPEQAGSWAYVQDWMNDEEIAFTMITGLCGRLYLSGFLYRMAAGQLQLVTDAVDLFKDIRDHTTRAVPQWPMGLPQWYADSLALSLVDGDRTLLFVWHRGEAGAELKLTLPAAAGDLVQRYPASLDPWDISDGADGADGEIVMRPTTAGPTARVYELPGSATHTA